MSPRQLTTDDSPADPFTIEWKVGERYTSPSRTTIRRYLDEHGRGDPHRSGWGSGWGASGSEDINALQALELLVEMREQLEHEIDRWVLYGLDNGATLRQLAGSLALTRQGLSKRLATRRPEWS
jgi:hypothetical protein